MIQLTLSNQTECIEVVKYIEILVNIKSKPLCKTEKTKKKRNKKFNMKTRNIELRKKKHLSRHHAMTCNMLKLSKLSTDWVLTIPSRAIPPPLDNSPSDSCRQFPPEQFPDWRISPQTSDSWQSPRGNGLGLREEGNYPWGNVLKSLQIAIRP